MLGVLVLYSIQCYTGATASTNSEFAPNTQHHLTNVMFF